MAELAAHHVRKFYEGKDWFAGLQLIFSSKGWAMLIGVHLTEERTPKKAILAVQGLFDIPVWLYDADAMVVTKRETLQPTQS